MFVSFRNILLVFSYFSFLFINFIPTHLFHKFIIYSLILFLFDTILVFRF